MVRLPTALIQATLLACLAGSVSPETPPAHTSTVPPVDQIVESMRQHDAYQARQLEHYDAIRHYQVQYRGFKVNIAANMDVQVNYDQASGKTFRVLSQSGSKLLCDKVLKRAIESEREASQDRQSTALTPANYRFQLAGTVMLDGRTTYIVEVNPLRDGKFLYRGRIWVDATEYAVRKIEVEPAKNPSFWITSTQIQNTNSDVDGVCLPGKNRSESKIRIGGTAVLTIDYGKYHVVLASPSPAAGNGLSPRQPIATEASF